MRALATTFSLGLLAACAPFDVGAGPRDRTSMPLDSATDDELGPYKDAHYAAIPRAEGPAYGWERLLVALRGRRLLLIGDVHDDRRLHETLRRLLTALTVEMGTGAGRRVWLLVESVGTEEGLVLQPGQALGPGEAREEALRRLRQQLLARWPGSWMERESVHGDFYRDLFRIAALGRWGFAGFEPIPRLALADRDERIAASVRARVTEAGDGLVIALVGHAHLLGPGRLRERLASFDPLVLLPRRVPGEGPGPAPLPFLRLADGIWLVRPLPGSEAGARR